MQDILRVGVVGAGYFARFHLDGWRRVDGARLVAVCDRDAERARAAAEQHGVGAVYDDALVMLDEARPDLLDVATPPTSHAALIEAAVARGVPIVCQKPFTTSLAEASRVVDLADAAGVPLIVHENFRFQPWHREAKALLEAGTLGEPYQVTFRLRPGDGQGPRAYLDRQPYFQTMERFLVHETAIHFIDVFRFLFGEVRTVYADLRRLNPVIAGEDAGILLLGFEGGRVGLFDGNRLVDHAAANRRLTMGEMTLEGADAVLRLDGDGRLFLRRHGANDEQTVDYAWDERGFGGDSVRALQQHVVDHLRRGTPLANPGRAYLRNLQVEAAVYQSSACGRRIEVPAGGNP